MTRTAYFLLSLVFFISSLTADPIENTSSDSLASTEGLVDSIIGGHVCAITGAFVDTQIDMVIPGPSPLVLQRSYCSQDPYSGHLWRSWQLFEPTQLVITDNIKGVYAEAFVTTSLGAKAKYRKFITKEKGILKFQFEPTKGFTNCGSGIINGKTNLKNNELKINNHDKKYLYSAELTSGNGDVRSFVFRYQDLSENFCFDMISEKKPDRTKKSYWYGNNVRVQKIQCSNWSENQLYGELTFNHPKKMESNSYITVISNSGKKVRYYFRSNKYNTRLLGRRVRTHDFYIDRVERPDKPHESYQYVKASRIHHHLQLSQKSRPDGRILQIEYYEDGTNKVGKEKIKIKKRDRSVDRVKCIKARVGSDDTLYDTHRFFYHFTENKEHILQSGITEVLDIYNHKTAYHYNKHERLSNVIKFCGPNIYSDEVYVWGPKHDPDHGNLKAKYLQDASGHILKGTFIDYDSRGNVIESKEMGSITGLETPPLSLGSKSKPIDNGADCYCHTYSYGKNNNLLSHSETNGKKIQFSYYPNSNAITKKLISDVTEKIVNREFCEYDENLFLIKKIIDDGSGRASEDLNGATIRKLTYYTPTKQFPFGLPECIEDKYYDFQTNQECLLHRTINHYSIEGYLLNQEHYDSEGKHRYTLLREYNAHGMITKEVNALGQEIIRDYDANDNCIFEQGPCYDYHTKFAYDYSNRLTRIDEIHSDLTFTTSYRYDLLGNKIAEVDRHGNEIRFRYDEFNRLVETIYPPVLDEWNQLVQPKERFEYDILGNCILMQDKCGFITTKKYNVKGSPTFIAYPDGTTERFQYNLDGSLYKSVSKQGSYTLYQRDCLGRVEAEEVYSASDALLSCKKYVHGGFNLESEEDAEGHITYYTYDGAGRLISKTLEDQRTTFEYDSLGRLAKELQWVSSEVAQVTSYTYDILDRVIEEKIQDLTDRIFLCTQYGYNIFGQKTFTRIGDSIEQTFYNDLQDPYKIIDAEGNETHIEIDYHYRNELNQNVIRKCQTDPMGNQTIQIQDVLGRLVYESQRDAFGRLLSQKENRYNLEGNLVEVNHDRVAQGEIASSVRHRWTYNAMHEVVALIQAVGTSDQRITSYEYNSFGQKALTRKPDDILLFYDYDAKGRLDRYHSSDGSIDYRYTYNLNDQVTQVNFHDTDTLRSYDALGRLTEETLANGLRLNYEYDALNRVTQLSLPDGSSIDYIYDALNLLKIERHGNQSYCHSYDCYDLYGNLLRSTLPFQAGAINYSYDLLQRERSITHPVRAQVIPQDGFDKAGNLLHFEVNDPLGCYNARFTYDALYQLNTESGLEDHQYQYDSLYNRIEKDQSPCQIDQLDQILSQEDSEFRYDLNGSLIKKITPNGDVSYKYDALNRLIQVETSSETVNYTYDPFDRRLSKQGDLKELYLYDGQNEIGIIVDQQVIALRILGLSKGAEIGGAVAYEIGEQTLIPLHDHNGNVVTLLNTAGEPTKTYRYTAFGLEMNRDSADINPWRFSSKHYDSETDFIYFGRRYYDPTVGRFITSDPAEYEDGPNLHAYLHNNPLNHYDAYGLWGEDFFEGVDYCVAERDQYFYEMGQGICALGLKLGEYKSADFEQERGFDGPRSDYLRARVKEDCEGLIEFGKSLKDRPSATIAQILAPGAIQACNLPADASYKDKCQAWTRAGLDISLLAGGLVAKAGKIGTAAKVTSVAETTAKATSVAEGVFPKIASQSAVATMMEGGGLNGSACSSFNSARLRNSLVAREIAGGHSFEKHILDHREFPGIRTRKQFSNHIENVLNNPSDTKTLRNNRTGYWHHESGTVVVRNPNALDGGTVFQPRNGNKYFYDTLR